MKSERVFVFDTNAFVSAHLISGSVNDKALRKVLELGYLALSDDLVTEISEVLYRPKFDRYFSDSDGRDAVLEKISLLGRHFATIEKITVCTDADDNMVLELAVASKATAVVTGDKALLALHPFRTIPIVTASTFLEMF
ncbi:MAG: putative toxin-antitoxin system toxin component, PIN family [Bacteroidetes bacterium CHB5]|nr:putative toxin-antitoxin system toxin component, PIN family [Bacteroidetes bacterium CHB5]